MVRGPAGYASAAEPSPAAAVAGLLRDGAPRVAVATYLLAPGLFADRIRQAALAAGAVAVSPALGARAEVADVLLDRFAEARSQRRSAARVSAAESAQESAQHESAQHESAQHESAQHKSG